MPSPTERWPAAWDEPGLLTPKQRVRAVVDAITDGTQPAPISFRAGRPRPSLLSSVINKLRWQMPTETSFP